MVDFVHRFCIRSVKMLCYACSVMVLFSSSLLRKFLVFCGLVKVLGPWCTINFRLVQFVNIQHYWITLFLLFLILVISLWPRKGLVCKQSKSATQENHTSISQLKVEVSLRQPSLSNYYCYQIIKFKTFLDSIHGYINIRAMKDKSEQMNNWVSLIG